MKRTVPRNRTSKRARTEWHGTRKMPIRTYKCQTHPAPLCMSAAQSTEYAVLSKRIGIYFKLFGILIVLENAGTVL